MQCQTEAVSIARRSHIATCKGDIHAIACNDDKVFYGKRNKTYSAVVFLYNRFYMRSHNVVVVTLGSTQTVELVGVARSISCCLLLSCRVRNCTIESAIVRIALALAAIKYVEGNASVV